MARHMLVFRPTRVPSGVLGRRSLFDRFVSPQCSVRFFICVGSSRFGVPLRFVRNLRGDFGIGEITEGGLVCARHTFD